MNRPKYSWFLAMLALAQLVTAGTITPLDGEWLPAAGNVLGSVTLCMLGVWLGSLAAAAFNQLKGA